MKKRKYTRKVKLDALGCDSSPIKQESSINLPPDILKSIERTVLHRKALGLFDDREERIERALRYQEFRNASK
uniref:Uncharacterized protein n=2 Tax=viral metagenome TaxID=1070528 RepID=A0A6M3KRU3_9ZZZZ